MEPVDEDKLEQLSRELHEKDEALQMAAKFGKELLATNSELTRSLEEANTSSAAKIEALEQQCHSLRQKLEQNRHMQDEFSDELEALEKQHSRAHQQHSTEISQMQQQLGDKQRQIDSLTSECERGHQVQICLRERVDELMSEAEAATIRHREDMAAMNQSRLDSTQTEHLTEETKAHLVKLEQTVDELHAGKQRLQAQVEKLDANLQNKQWELQESESQTMSHYKTLEKAREEIQELKVEIDILQMDSQNQKKKGNSLFSEVEDRRVEAEQTLLSLKSKYQALQHTFKVTSEQFCRVKMQLAGMLQLCGQWADQAHVERLQRQLSQARSQLHDLINSRSNKQDEFAVNTTDSQPPKEQDDQIAFLNALLSFKEKKISELDDEVRNKDLALYAESQKVIDRERQLYNVEENRDQLKAKVLKLEVQVSELLLKYDPGSMSANATTRKVTLEKIPTEDEDEKKENANINETTTNKVNLKPKNEEQDPGMKRCLEKLARKRRLAAPLAAQSVDDNPMTFKSDRKKKAVSLADVMPDPEMSKIEEVEVSVFEEMPAPKISPPNKLLHGHEKKSKVGSTEVKPECNQQ